VIEEGMTPRSTNSDTPSNLKLAKSLESFFKGRQEIILVFLFGSSARNRLRPSSDVDIGILFKSIPEIEAKNALTQELSSILKREVDLVALDHASPILRMQILKHGILVYSRRKKDFYQFFTDTVNQYDDLKRIRKNCEENILRGRIYAG
jgi:predicted nucleotidyltransferase